ncbi:hypothetical protein GGS24DRAFT_418280 [Hypoxylon argillaceum]|nr:hypothetical protein GGS24DRAFT_418280 [Hypoxylon argillaceum]KAI1153045.1 hypothetical protein F4825DRAFT_282584 [Nemania diffusa]
MAPDIYHLNGPNGPNGPNRPTSGPAGRQGGPQHGPQPGTQGFPQQGHPQGHSAVPSGPPRNMNPGRGPSYQIQDVSVLSEADKKEELTDYRVVRFERVVDREAFDEQGQLKRPSWERVIRAEDHGISNQTAAKKVRQLNRSTKDVIDKKNSLPPALKRQVDKMLDDLISRESEGDCYCWVLAQMDHQLRAIEPFYYTGLDQYHGPTRKHSLCISSSRRRSRSRSHHHKKKKRAYERLSLTAYFQRLPRPGIDIIKLWNARKKGLEINYSRPANANNASPQTQPGHGPPQGPPPNRNQPGGHPSGRPPGGPPGHQPGAHPPGGRPPSGPPAGVHPAGHHPAHQNRPMAQGPNQPHGGQGQRQNQRWDDRRAIRASSDSSSESDSRRSRSSSGRSRRGGTPPSSVSDNHSYVRDSGHRLPHPRPGDAGGGHRTSGLPRLPPHRAPRAPAPPYPLSHGGDSVASNMERMREHAYQRGVEDGQMRPRVVHEHPAAMYHRVRGGRDASIDRFFEQLRLDDDYDDELRRRRRRELEKRVQRGSVLEGDPFEGSSTSAASSSRYTYSTDGRGRSRAPPIIRIPERRPLSPRLRRGLYY